MLPQYDSKMFCGVELGRLIDVIERFIVIVPKPPHQPEDLIDFVGYINTQLPNEVYLEVTYPHRDCREEDFIAHLNLLDDGEEMSMKRMKKFLKKANLAGYGHVLGQLGIEYEKPRFYTRHYVYYVESNQEEDQERHAEYHLCLHSLDDIVDAIQSNTNITLKELDGILNDLTDSK